MRSDGISHAERGGIGRARIERSPLPRDVARTDRIALSVALSVAVSVAIAVGTAGTLGPVVVCCLDRRRLAAAAPVGGGRPVRGCRLRVVKRIRRLRRERWRGRDGSPCADLAPDKLVA